MRFLGGAQEGHKNPPGKIPKNSPASVLFGGGGGSKVALICQEIRIFYL
jgi:hypothetical protein